MSTSRAPDVYQLALATSTLGCGLLLVGIGTAVVSAGAKGAVALAPALAVIGGAGIVVMWIRGGDLLLPAVLFGALLIIEPARVAFHRTACQTMETEEELVGAETQTFARCRRCGHLTREEP